MSDYEELLMMRETFYGFLSRLFTEEPPKVLAEDIISGSFPLFNVEVLSVNKEIGEGVNLLKELGKRYSDVNELHEKMVSEYTRFFIGPGALPFEPYESSWVDGERLGKSLLEVKTCYSEAGIERAAEYPEPEDYIAFELKFMQHLSMMARTDRDQREATLKTQHKFLSEHLLTWVPQFADALYEYPETEFFNAVAKITKGFLLLDGTFLKEFAKNI